MAYCKVIDLKALGYSIPDADEAYVEQLCEAASAKVDSYCHQTFTLAENAEETHRVRVQNGIMKVFPRNLTVNQVRSVVMMEMPSLHTTVYEVKVFAYIPEGAVIVCTTNAPDGDYYIMLTYDYGYKPCEYPSDLVMATAFMASSMVDDYTTASETNMSGLKTLQQGKLRIERGNFSASSRLDAAGFPASATALLNGGGYVRVRGDWL